MRQTSNDLRARARRFENREHPTATRFPPEFREEVVALARERRALGVPVARIATEMGVKTRTLALWLRSAPKRRLRRVKLTPDASGVAPALAPSTLAVTVGAVRVDGLDLASVVMLVRALA
jgi:transposase-like protein